MADGLSSGGNWRAVCRQHRDPAHPSRDASPSPSTTARSLTMATTASAMVESLLGNVTWTTLFVVRIDHRGGGLRRHTTGIVEEEPAGVGGLSGDHVRVEDVPDDGCSALAASGDDSGAHQIRTECPSRLDHLGDRVLVDFVGGVLRTRNLGDRVLVDRCPEYLVEHAVREGCDDNGLSVPMVTAMAGSRLPPGRRHRCSWPRSGCPVGCRQAQGQRRCGRDTNWAALVPDGWSRMVYEDGSEFQVVDNVVAIPAVDGRPLTTNLVHQDGQAYPVVVMAWQQIPGEGLRQVICSVVVVVHEDSGMA